VPSESELMLQLAVRPKPLYRIVRFIFFTLRAELNLGDKTLDFLVNLC
jgi:hypothetical protein